MNKIIFPLIFSFRFIIINSIILIFFPCFYFDIMIETKVVNLNSFWLGYIINNCVLICWVVMDI